jgi:hypothetical protein
VWNVGNGRKKSEEAWQVPLVKGGPLYPLPSWFTREGRHAKQRKSNSSSRRKSYSANGGGSMVRVFPTSWREPFLMGTGISMLFDQFFRDFDSLRFEFSAGYGPTDMYERDRNLVFETELPGMREKASTSKWRREDWSSSGSVKGAKRWTKRTTSTLADDTVGSSDPSHFPKRRRK